MVRFFWKIPCYGTLLAKIYIQYLQLLFIIKNEKEVIDITNDPNYVVSKGDVSLENIELSVNENELVINSKKKGC